jgi:hypothetical protein
MNILLLFSKNPLPPCLAYLKGNIVKSDVISVTDNLPLTIHLLLNREKAFVQIKVNSFFHYMKQLGRGVT